MINRIDLLATPCFSNELSQSIEFLHSNKTQQYCISTFEEEKMIERAIYELSQRIEEILSNYVNYFPDNKPNGILTSMVSIFQLFKMEYELFSPISYKRLLEDCISVCQLFTKIQRNLSPEIVKRSRRKCWQMKK
jgi:hypothetical protein